MVGLLRTPRRRRGDAGRARQRGDRWHHGRSRWAAAAAAEAGQIAGSHAALPAAGSQDWSGRLCRPGDQEGRNRRAGRRRRGDPRDQTRDGPAQRAASAGADPRYAYDTREQQAALQRLAGDFVERGSAADSRYGALRGILRGDLPRTTARAVGEDLQDGGFNLDEAKRIAAGLEDSHLFVQGPPGSGKTYNGAHLICHLLGRGARVGVASSSHAAIHNLLTEVERFAGDDPPWRGLKKHSGTPESHFRSERGEDALIDNSDRIEDFIGDHAQLVAGTAWLFAREELDGKLDYLFIDEAGQLSLADALAIGTSARNLILLGDPLQLAQVSQAIHPPGTGASVLEHLLGDHATVPRSRGLFIDETRRMHPAVCRFISEAIYEGRLESFEDCGRQGLSASGELTGTGVRYVPVVHEGNVRQAPEEVHGIASHLECLLNGRYVDDEGESRRLQAKDVMVVAPYNAQVRCLREHLPDGVRVGTVDKFQGQEAVVTFFSMATSSGAELPRNLEFLFSRNRLNVALSRARCLAVLVCSPELLHCALSLGGADATGERAVPTGGGRLRADGRPLSRARR